MSSRLEGELYGVDRLSWLISTNLVIKRSALPFSCGVVAAGGSSHSFESWRLSKVKALFSEIFLRSTGGWMSTFSSDGYFKIGLGSLGSEFCDALLSLADSSARFLNLPFRNLLRAFVLTAVYAAIGSE